MSSWATCEVPPRTGLRRIPWADIRVLMVTDGALFTYGAQHKDRMHSRINVTVA